MQIAAAWVEEVAVLEDSREEGEDMVEADDDEEIDDIVQNQQQSTIVSYMHTTTGIVGVNAENYRFAALFERERESSISQKQLLLLLTMSAAMIGGTGRVTSNKGETKKPSNRKVHKTKVQNHV